MSATIIARRCALCIDDPREFRDPRPKNHLVDVTGQTFNRLYVEHFLGIGASRKAFWCCTCRCGTAAIIIGSHLRNNNSASCGCIRKENQLAMHQTHGLSHTKEFSVWQGMIQRCQNPHQPAYKYYGGRGITVCDRWLLFENFYADMGDRPEGLSLERKDNDQGYSPDNCYWATRSEQMNNTRANRLFTWENETYTLAQLARKVGQTYGGLYARLDHWPDSLEHILTAPPKRRGRHTRASKKEN